MSNRQWYYHTGYLLLCFWSNFFDQNLEFQKKKTFTPHPSFTHKHICHTTPVLITCLRFCSVHLINFHFALLLNSMIYIYFYQNFTDKIHKLLEFHLFIFRFSILCFLLKFACYKCHKSIRILAAANIS